MFQIHDERLFTLTETPLRLPVYIATGIVDKISDIPVSSAGSSNFEDETSSLSLAPLLNSNAARTSMGMLSPAKSVMKIRGDVLFPS